MFGKIKLCFAMLGLVLMYPLMLLADILPNPLPTPSGLPVVIQPAIDPANTNDVLMYVLQASGGIKGASALIVVVLLVQLAMFLLRTPLGDKMGKYKLITMYALTVVLSALIMKLMGLSWSQVILNSQVLSAMQVFGHQAVTQFLEKPATSATPTAPTPQA